MTFRDDLACIARPEYWQLGAPHSYYMNREASFNNDPYGRVTADQETASDGYASRFAGEIGTWFLDVQRKLVLSAAGDSRSILDVGGGHLQVASAFIGPGRRVAIAGSGSAARHQLSKVSSLPIEFIDGDLLALPVKDREFESVVCLRLLAHCEPWKELIRELCRISGRRVIVDYPTWQSANLLTPWLFNAKKGVEKNTRPYLLFWHKQIREVFEQNGFCLRSSVNQFTFPMAIHRALKKVKISSALEKMAAACGATAVFGSPALATFERISATGGV